MDRQSILQKYEYKVDFETQLQDDKDFWAVSSQKRIAEIDQIRKQMLETFFSKLQRHEKLLYDIKDGCEKAQNKPDLQKFELFVCYYESAFNVEKTRFYQVFQDEMEDVSKFYQESNLFLKDSEWAVYGNSAGLKSRDKQSRLCDKMRDFISLWYKLFLQHDFYDADAHQKYIFYPDADM